ncbi:hypothetical protein GCM10017710_23940 [Arthrobacter ramosus]
MERRQLAKFLYCPHNVPGDADGRTEAFPTMHHTVTDGLKGPSIRFVINRRVDHIEHSTKETRTQRALLRPINHSIKQESRARSRCSDAPHLVFQG